MNITLFTVEIHTVSMLQVDFSCYTRSSEHWALTCELWQAPSHTDGDGVGGRMHVIWGWMRESVRDRVCGWMCV